MIQKRRCLPFLLGLAMLAGAGCEVTVDDRSLTTEVGGALVGGTAGGTGPAGHLITGRVTIEDGTVYEGRLRWGTDEEALWSNYFNGAKEENVWASHAPAESLPRERVALELFDREIVGWDRRTDLRRPFMVRFGDIARIDARDRDLRVVLKSGTEFDLDRYGADDLADGVRVWDLRRGVVDIGEWSIRSIEFLPVPGVETAPRPLFGTVRTALGEFTGLVQWDREACLTSDELVGRRSGREVRVAFADVRSIARRSGDSSVVTLVDGTEIVLAEPDRSGAGNRGVYVDDSRYGRVLVSWDAFEHVEFAPASGAPAYGDFRAGRPLEGTVVTRTGRRLTGRLVYDLDESETTETLDAPRGGVDYTIPFERIAAIVPHGPDEHGAHHARVLLAGGEELHLERAGDLGDGNAGLLVFPGSGGGAEYVPWADVERIELDHSS